MTDNNFKIFFATDFHGSTACFKKFIAAKKFYNVDYLIMGGDITGKSIAIIYKKWDGTYRVNDVNNGLRVEKSDLEEYLNSLENRGVYCHIEDESAHFKNIEVRKIQSLYNQNVAERFHYWIKYAEEKLEKQTRILFIAGNDDASRVDDIFVKSQRFMRVDGHNFKIDNRFNIIGYSYTTPTPWKTPREKKELDIGADLTKMGYPHNGLPVILNFHIPPKGTGIDTATALDSEFRPVINNMGIEKINVGSEKVRDYIISNEPTLGLFGHVHEGRGVTKVGETICINPGSIFYEGKLQGCICSFKDGKLISWQLTEG